MTDQTSASTATVVGGRRVQFEMFFTLPDFSDISLRDYQETMQRPFFSLSKKKRIKPIEYVSPDKQVTVHVSANPEYGMATIWDADIMIYLASHLNELRERGANDLSPTIRLQPGDLLKRICWGVSGRDMSALSAPSIDSRRPRSRPTFVPTRKPARQLSRGLIAILTWSMSGHSDRWGWKSRCRNGSLTG